MFFKKIAFLSLLLSSLTLASDLSDDQLGLARESGKPSHQRSYQTPVDTSKNIVVRLPTKETYFARLALDALHADGVKSTKDKPMEILERNAIIKGMHTQKTPLTGGKMIMPVSDKLEVVYRCAEGTSYPETGTIVSSNQDVEPPVIANDGIIAATLQ